ncbi:uncharacterized protein LOC114122428 [Aphis gossypii]|uniref:uncharacterized protein LOC114122428 n=1 Tax=Aphis gossypii TaxID=80765 RepID=UPI002158EB7A|nr:uncharacterized protein LOC114122428 [Aphis gossypii]
MQQYKGNKKNESPLQRPLENINEMLNWIKKKKRRLFEEIYTNQASISDLKSVNSKSDTIRDLSKESINYVGLPNSFYNSTLKVLEEYVRDKKQKKSKSNNNNWINIELMRYICNLLKMSPSEVDNLSVSSNSGIQLEQSILEISKANLEYHKDILNYISKCLDTNLSDISQDQALSSPQYIGLLDKLYKLADYYTEKAQEMRNICLESPRVEINSLDEDSLEQITDNNPRDCKTSGSLTSELSVDGAYVLEHLSTLLEQRGLICTDREWPIFGKDDDDGRSLTDQLLDIKPHIKSKDIKVERSEKGFLSLIFFLSSHLSIRSSRNYKNNLLTIHCFVFQRPNRKCLNTMKYMLLGFMYLIQ